MAPQIVEIGCIELENLIPTKKFFYKYLNPERKVSESAIRSTDMMIISYLIKKNLEK